MNNSIEKQKTTDDSAPAYYIPISAGIFKHCRRMGRALPLFIWYIDKTTREKNVRGEKYGYVFGGQVVYDDQPAHDLGVSHSTISRWRCRLEAEGYIVLQRSRQGYIIMVCRSKKWTGEGKRTAA